MANFVLIFICLIVGLALRWSQKLPENTPHVLNTFVIYLSFPALVFVQTPALLAKTGISWDLLIPASMAWLQFALAAMTFIGLSLWTGWSRATVGALILTAGLGNTSFVGFPVLEALFGPDSLRTGIIVDQVGSFLALSSLGLITASICASGRPSLTAIVRRIMTFPPFIAVLIATAFYFVGLSLPPPLMGALEKMGATLVPLALVSVGFQLKVRPAVLKRRAAPLGVGLAFKLLLVPLVLGILYVGLMGSHSLSTQITLIEAAMAPMITGAIIATEFDLDAELANLMVGLGVPLSLLTVPIFYWLSRSIFTS